MCERCLEKGLYHKGAIVHHKIYIDDDNLDDDIQILVLQDDGMGYGARNGYCSDIYVSENKDGKKEVQIWF